MMSIFRTHWRIIPAAFAVGLLIVAPTVSAIRQINPDFKGIYPMFNNDEDQYLSMTREAYDGHYNFGSVYLKEHKGAPYLQQPLAEIIMAEMARISRISIPALFALNDFVLPAVGVTALYFLIFAVSGSGSAALIFSSGYYFVLNYWFNRPVNPQFSFIFLFLGLFLIWKIFGEGTRSLKEYVRLNILLAIDFGIAFYIYPFVWSSILVVYCLFAAALAYLRTEGVRYYAGNFLAFAVPAGLFSAPYILNLQRAAADVSYLDQNLRFGFLSTHWPHAYFNVALMFLSLAVLLMSGIGTGRRGVFAFVLAFSGIILNWQNVITGKAFSFSMHYYWVVVLFVFIIFAICSGFLNVAHVSGGIRPRRIAAILLMTAVMGIISYRERDSISGILSFAEPLDIGEFRRVQDFSGVSEWLNANSEKDSVVYSLGGNYIQLIPIYTHNNDFYNPNSGLYMISDDELENRWAIQNILRKNIDAGYIKEHNVEIWANKFIEKYQNQIVRNKLLDILSGKQSEDPEFIPQEYIDRVFWKMDFYRNLGFEKSLAQYGADYVLLDRNDPEFGHLSDEFRTSDFLILSVEIENHLIFKTVK